jgi:hypothetical protein
MADVVAATLDPAPVAPSRAAVRNGAKWVVETGCGTVPVLAPARRPSRGDAPATGADTTAVLAELGIPRP